MALNYLSRTLVGAENNYSPIEKLCLVLFFMVKKLRHYLVSHEVKLIARADHFKFILNRGRVSKWAVILLEFDIVYVPQKAIKRQALAGFLAAHPVPEDCPLAIKLPDDEVLTTEEALPHWGMYFDGASRNTSISKEGVIMRSAGAEIVFRTP